MKKSIIYAGLLSTFSAFAQTDTSQVLENIVVSENRLQLNFPEISRHIEIITRKQIAAAPVQNIAELLTYVSGVDVRQRGVQGVQPDITLRGSTFDQVLILVNGVKMSDPQTGHHALNLPFDIEAVERIEIIKGPAARVYGQNAFAGAINIVTRQDMPNSGKMRLQVGDYGLVNGRLSAAVKTSNAQHFASTEFGKANGYRSNTDYAIGSIFYQVRSKHINVMSGFVRRAFGASGFYAPTNTSSERESIKTGFVAVDAPMQFGQFKLTPRLSWRNNEDYYKYAPTLRANFTVTNVITAEANGQYNSKFGKTGIGLEYQKQMFLNNNSVDTSRNISSIYLEHRFQFWQNRIDITPGVLVSNYSDFGFNAFPGIDLGVRITEGVKFFANYGKTNRIPTYTDLYFKNAANLNNLALKPESANQYEFGLKYFGSTVTIQASYFERDGINFIDRTKNTPTELWKPTNTNNVLLKGIDLSTAVRLPFANSRFDISYVSITDFRRNSEQALSRYVFDFLKEQVNIGYNYTILGNLNHTIRGRYCKRISQNADYFVVDSKLAWNTKRYEFFAQASNIFDETYTEQNNIPMPKRWFSLGFALNIVPED